MHTQKVVSFANVFVIENVVEITHVKKTKRGQKCLSVKTFEILGIL